MIDADAAWTFDRRCSQTATRERDWLLGSAAVQPKEPSATWDPSVAIASLRRAKMSYVVTRPRGASVADYISKPQKLGGINFGDGPTALMFSVAVFVLVAYLALARPDIQEPLESAAASPRSAPLLPGLLHTDEPEVEVD
jgi:hypothetical protein